MLVLTRKVNQKLLIGDDITIIVARIKADEVRLAIDAPRTVPIVRAEARKMEQHDYDNQEAAAVEFERRIENEGRMAERTLNQIGWNDDTLFLSLNLSESQFKLISEAIGRLDDDRPIEAKLHQICLEWIAWQEESCSE